MSVDANKKSRPLMPQQKAEERNKNFLEVALGYDKETAVREAKRCLNCKNAKCIQGCPVEIDIPLFIKKIAEEDFEASIKVMKESNNLPAICGRVCPQEDQCEKKCILGIKGDPIAIGRLERFIADWERENKKESLTPKEVSSKMRVAVVGSGPAGLTCAADLARIGYKVTIFESLDTPGGVLSYGIPEFRLPKEIVKSEIDYIKNLGVEVKTNMVIGKILTIHDLKKDFSAIFIASGAGLPSFMKIPGENLSGVYSANEFLTRVNLMKAYLFPKYPTPVKVGKKVVVVGGGNVAMDAARSALRMGAKTTIVYRRSEAEMPARLEEVHHAKEEGIEFKILTNPVRIIGDKDGKVTAIEVLKMELGEPDKSGRRRPLPIKGSEYTIPTEIVIMAIGQKPNPLISQTTKDLKVESWGGIIADEETLATSIEGVYAGGDIVTGAATVITAMGAGKKAAQAIDLYLKGGK